MSAVLHSLILIGAVIIAYVWLQIPFLNQYSLQVFVLSIAVYLGLKRLKKAELWHIAPTAHSLELALLTFAFLLVIGATGATTSILYPLTYVLLFFVVFSSRLTIALITVATIMLYYYALAPLLSQSNLSLLGTLPLLALFFVFAKAQYQQVSREQAQHTQDEALLSRYSDYHQQLSTFVTSFIQPKLEHIIELLDFPTENQKTLLSQVTLLQVEIEKMTNRLKPSNLVAKAPAQLQAELPVSPTSPATSTPIPTTPEADRDESAD